MKRLAILVGFLVIAMVAAVAPTGQPTEAQVFSESGFGISNPAFQRYFNDRGQVRILGYPISRSFILEGFEVQIFQRVILQLQGDRVERLNVLDPDIMPLTRANQSVFPPSDPNLAARAPQAGSADYAQRVVQFIREVAPDSFQNQRVNFFNLFNTTVPSQAAGGNNDLNTLQNLEIWGVPTSQPAPDPGNGGFIYQRFQRGIMHYRAEVPVTEGILVGQYFKAVITGQSLPTDVAEDTRNSRFFSQYNTSATNAVNRPAVLQNTSLVNAFEPGQGGPTAPVPVTVTPTTPTATATVTPNGTVTPTATPISGDALPTIRFNIDDSNRRIDFGQTIRVEIIAEDDKGLDRIEFEGEISQNDNGNDNTSTANDPAFERRIFEDECEDRTVCAVVFDITPRSSGDFTLVARARDQARQTAETTLEVRVRPDRTSIPTVTASVSANEIVRPAQMTVTVTGTDDISVTRLELEGRNTPDTTLNKVTTFDCPSSTTCTNAFTFRPNDAGNYTMVARARDSNGQVRETTVQFRVRNAS